MSNIRTPNDYGAAWRHNGECYHKLNSQPSLGAATDSAQTGDVLNYADYAWQYDDSGTENGTVHRTWTACQMCVANLPAHVGASADNYPTAEEIFTAPCAGVIRITGAGSKYNTIKIYVNGTEVASTWGDETFPVRLVSDDVVSVKSSGSDQSITSIFLPYVWPTP
jgi:hypothetical protein